MVSERHSGTDFRSPPDFPYIDGIVVTDGVLYTSELRNKRIRKRRDGIVSTSSRTGEGSFWDRDSNVAQFGKYMGIALDSQGRLLVADSYNHRIRVVAMDGSTTTLAGTGRCGSAVVRVGPSQQQLFIIQWLSSLLDGLIYVPQENSIRKISTDGIVTTIAGSGQRVVVDGPGNEVASITRQAWPSHRKARSSSVIRTTIDCEEWTSTTGM